MRLPNNLHARAFGFNMTPMIDVVFLLIIFFLVSSHLAKQETQFQLPLPTADSGSENLPSRTDRLTINVLLDGALLVAGRQVSAADLPQRLEDKLRDAGPNLQVRIRSDRRAAYRHVEPVMLACARTGIWDVSFSVYRSEDVP